MTRRQGTEPTDSVRETGDPASTTTVLERRIRSRIERKGPLPFAEFMALALTDPEGGYYTSAAARPTPGGDYLTAPELHPIFGQCLALQVVEVWERLGRPVPFILREYGAGAGTLALAVLEEIEREAPRLAEGILYEPVELNRHRLEELRERFAARGMAPKIREADEGIPAGVVVANEYLDALPVHRLVLRRAGLRERYVDWREGQFVEVEGPVSDPGLEVAFRDLEVTSPDVVVEIRPEVRRWVEVLAAQLAAGVVIVVDYGGSSAELFGPHQPEGTVVGYRGHRVAPSALADPGSQDLTAHVDFSDLLSAARRQGFDVLGETSQAAFLMGCGLEGLLRRAIADPETTLQGLLVLRSAIRRLLDPRLLGGFRVAIFGRGISPVPLLRGLAYRLPERATAAGGA
ncbi:MAG TPA: SAM-dependent methyltransferase [Candidatus Limnocylindrales bacterium]|nr:SAM-dependent methyltransferase [Candidatus Limnocylindrales bacterium]